MASARKKRFAALLATVLFSMLFVFQILLTAGVPLGRSAYGGKSAVLSPGLRMTSALSALILIVAAWTVLARSGFLRVGRRTAGIARWLIWGFAVLFILSGVANLASSSPWENFLMAPLALVIVVCCVLVALSPKTHLSPDSSEKNK